MAPSTPSGRFVTAPDLPTLEADLLEAVRGEDESARADPRIFGRPAWLVVPSASLAAHLARRLVADGSSRLGWRILTLAECAREIVQRAGEPVLPGDLALELALRRTARADQVLGRSIARSEDGLDAVAATVRDLLDAGFELAERDAWLEAIEEGQPEPDERVRSLFDVALRIRAELDERGRLERGAVLRRAAELLQDRPELLSLRALFVHGFSDATHSAVRLLDALGSLPGSRLWLELPVDPFGQDQDSADSLAPPRRFVERMRLFARGTFVTTTELESSSATPVVDFAEAGTREDECDRVARAIRAALDADPALAPEDVGVVLRDPLPYRPYLFAALTQRTVPFSGFGLEAGLDGAGRRLEALLRLVAEGADAPLEVLDVALTDRAHAEALLAFQITGAARLADLATIDWTHFLPEQEKQSKKGKDEIELPQRRADSEGTGLKGAHLAVEAAERVRGAWTEKIAALRELANERTWREHRTGLSEFARQHLGWSDDSEVGLRLVRLLEQFDRDLDADEVLEHDELLRLLQRAVAKLGAPAWAGRGGGVQVLSTTEARARTFARLFVLGLNRGSFPQLAAEDPLLSDSLRARLAGAAPEFPVKARSYDEERHLFASLLRAAPHVTLTWRTDDGEGKPQLRAPIVDRLIKERGLEPLALDERSGLDPLVVRALAGDRAGWGRALEAEIDEAEARHLAAVVAELEGSAQGRARLGPFLGMIGAQPRPGELYVTRLEGWQKCPWQNLLVKLFKLEPRPDPLGELPDIDALMLGNAVHNTLEESVGTPRGLTLNEPGVLERARAMEREPAPAPEVLTRVATKIAQRSGVRWRGFARALERRALPYIRLAESALASPLVSEGKGLVEVAAGAWGSLPLRFRADLVEERDGRVLVTDFKTGKGINGSGVPARADTKHKHLLDALRAGSHLQAVAYARSFGGDAVGRYLFLHPDLDAAPEKREITAATDEADLNAAFDVTVDATLDGMAHGIHTARLRVRDKGVAKANRVCENCEVRIACSIGDSGAAARFVDLLEAEREALPVWRRALEPHLEDAL